jgi:hypothetical protein
MDTEGLKMKNKLNWIPKTSFIDLVSEMTLEDFKKVKKNEL